MRVHELAKELGKDSKEILNILAEKGSEAKSHMSALSDDDVAYVRSKFKKKISAVFNPQNSSTGKSFGGKNDSRQVIGRQEHSNKESKQGDRPNNRNQQDRQQQGERPQNNNRNQGDRPYNKDRQQGDRPYNNNRNQGDRPYNKDRQQGDRPYNNNRNQGDRPYNKDRQQGDRPYNNNRNQGDRPYNKEQQGDRPYNNNRNQGDRPYNKDRQQGDRPYNNNRNQGDRPYNKDRQQGDRPYNNNRNQGDRPPYNKDRQQGDRPYNNNRNQGDRPYNKDRQQGDRPYNNNRNQGDRPYNKDRQQGDRPYNNNRNQGDRPYNNNRNGDHPYNKDRQQGGRNDNRQGGQRRESKDVAADIRLETKTDSRYQNKQYKKDKTDKVHPDKFKDDLNLKKSDVKKEKPEVKEPEIKVIVIPEVLTIKELAEKLKLQPSALVKKLFLQGKVVTINQEVDFETAEEIALEYDVISEKEVKVDVIEELLKEEEEDPATLKSRPPVVCVMGHVDHGKTSLLDAIREANVISREAGGITQHIGAYVVEKNGQKITFLDTPGHEAFTAMRMRGAQSTDIAILVVAADDGVMPQTVEAINHAKAAGIHIIVAINKIDKPSANIDKVKQELTEYELVPEDWGGDTIFVPVSAHTHEGIDSLLEMVLLDAEMCELKANPDRKARGLVIEAKLDKGKGSVATVLVQKGTLRVGDNIAAGEAHGKVRAMMDDKGRRLKVAGPSTPIEILGLNGVPNAGETFVALENDKEARNFASVFISEGRQRLLGDTKAKLSLDDLFTQIQAGDVKELGIVVKADVQGSVEAMKQSLTKLSNKEVVVKIIHGGVGAINESDVILASASNAIIIGFNVKPDNQAREIADREKVDVRLYSVIYKAIEDVEGAMKGLLDPIYEEKVIGHAEVRQLFKASGVGVIAGSYVLDGVFKRDCKVRITREGEQIFEGNLASLKRFKDDVKEVKSGYECGLVFEEFSDLQELDVVEAYEMVEVPR